ncbi:MAG: DNA polymerase III subunit beta [Spirochaetia bacterium]|jgi:DNA polymerase-3 subunit beta|nr:DNA polymerase III subunit beta [Spirochaetales bacterium]MDX9783627.1 DNA polymerase III subunit beta [Spirochaetia bacterium]
MKFTCDKASLLREIAFAQEIIASKNALSIMSNVYLEVSDSRLLIRATDVKVSFETTIPVDNVIPGSLTVFCDKLMGILTTLPDGDLTIEQDDGRIILKPAEKKVRFQLKSLSGEKFPELPRAEENLFFQLPSRDFRRMVSQTIFSVSNDETRYFMNGVYMEKTQEGSLVMVSTDGRRLAFVRSDTRGSLPDFKPVIIPTKVLGILLKRLSDEGMLDIAITEKSLFLRFNNYQISSVLIEGQFPNYQKVIPQNQKNSFSVKKADMLEALKRVSIFVEQKSYRTFFSVSENGLVLSSEESEIGAAREEIGCEYSGGETTIALNYKYIEEPLRVLDAEAFSIEFSDPSKAITLRPEPSGDYFHIVMPMQID